MKELLDIYLQILKFTILFQSGSCESLMCRDRIVGSVPGLLDAISCGSTADINVAAEEESSVPNILTVCFRHLEAHGLHTLGIFRVSTSKKRIRQVSTIFNILYTNARIVILNIRQKTLVFLIQV